VVVLCVLANIGYLAVLPFPEIQHAPQNRVAIAMMNAVFGRPGAMCMAAAIMISTFGCDNGLILVLPENCNHEQISGSRGSTRSTGNLDGPPRFAAHAYN